MTELYHNFLIHVETSKDKKIFKKYKKLGEYDYSNCTEQDIINIVSSFNPSCPVSISRICDNIREYALFINDKQLYDLVAKEKEHEIWETIKETYPKKFISYAEFNRIYNEIDSYEELNAVYYKTLFRSIYEGIYNDDMSIIKNLKSSDINGNMVTLYDDSDSSYVIEIHEELAEDLKRLRKINIWERYNRLGKTNVNIKGPFPDSCFKVENRKKSEDTLVRYSSSYYRTFKKIAIKYAGYDLTPKSLYISGIVHRIKMKLIEEGLSIEYAFTSRNRDPIARKIIFDELNKSNISSDIYFKRIVQKHINNFID